MPEITQSPSILSPGCIPSNAEIGPSSVPDLETRETSTGRLPIMRISGNREAYSSIRLKSITLRAIPVPVSRVAATDPAPVPDKVTRRARPINRYCVQPGRPIEKPGLREGFRKGKNALAGGRLRLRTVRLIELPFQRIP
jgi:hypothetical protein